MAEADWSLDKFRVFSRLTVQENLGMGAFRGW